MIEDKLTLIVGAGASLAAPSRLPIFRWIRDDLVRGLGIRLAPDAQTALDELAPEVLTQLLADEGAPIEESLAPAFLNASENALHWIAGEGAMRGAKVWTTNGDDLIERSHRGQLLRAAWCGRDPLDGVVAAAHLLKPHGSVASDAASPPVSRTSLAFSSSKVLAPLSAVWRDQLVADCAGRTVVLVGYAGADVDIRWILDAALETSANVIWFALESEHDELRSRYPRTFARQTARFGSNPRVNQQERPDIGFVAWAEARGLADRLPHRLREQLSESIATVHLEFRELAPCHAAAARLLSLLNDPRAARDRWWNGVRAGPIRVRVHCLIERFNLAFWSDEPIGRPVQLLASLPFQPPGRWGRWARRATATRLINHSSPRASRVARRAVEREPSLRNRLNLATSLRQGGQLSSALNIAVGCRQEALMGGRADLHGQSTWEEGYCLQLLGRLEESERVLSDLAKVFGPLASGRWIAWGHFGLASQCIYNGDARGALSLLAAAQSSFAGQGHTPGQRSCMLVSAMAYRMLGDLDNARAALAAIELSAPRLTREIIDFERAEAARFAGDLVAAEALYLDYVDSNSVLHVAIGNIGLGEIELERGLRPASAETAAEVAAESEMTFVELHALVTLVRAGVVNEDDGRVRRAAAQVPARKGIIGIERFCLSTHPERHSLFFP